MPHFFQVLKIKTFVYVSDAVNERRHIGHGNTQSIRVDDRARVNKRIGYAN